MEQIKYIPGDLVYIPKFGNNYTIMSSGKYYYEALDANYNDVVIENTDIVPIPLTPEILEKNGWRELKSKRYTWWKTRLGGFITLLNQIKIILLYGNFVEVILGIALKRLNMFINFNILYLV